MIPEPISEENRIYLDIPFSPQIIKWAGIGLYCYGAITNNTDYMAPAFLMFLFGETCHDAPEQKESELEKKLRATDKEA